MADFKIASAIRHKGEIYSPGDEEAFAENAAGADLESLREIGAVEGDLVEEMQDSLEDVDFASKAAEELAQEAGLRAEAFEGVGQGGETGYTKADVESLIE